MSRHEQTANAWEYGDDLFRELEEAKAAAEREARRADRRAAWLRLGKRAMRRVALFAAIYLGGLGLLAVRNSVTPETAAHALRIAARILIFP